MYIMYLEVLLYNNILTVITFFNAVFKQRTII